MADIIIMGLASETHQSLLMGVYEWQEEHSGGERPVYKLKDDDTIYLYYCDSEGMWIVGVKEAMLGRKAEGMMGVKVKALTADKITATWDRFDGTVWAKAPEVSGCCSRCCSFISVFVILCVQIRVLLATTDNIKALEQQREEEEQRAKQQAEERGNITMGGLAAGHEDFDLMGVYELMDVKEKWVNRRAVYKKAGNDAYLYFSNHGRWMIGSKENVDQGGGWMFAPSSCAFTPDDVPADSAWRAHANTGWVELPQVRARRN